MTASPVSPTSFPGPIGGLTLIDVRTHRSLSVPWGDTVTIGRGDPSGGRRHVGIPDERVSRLAAEIEVRDDSYLIISRQRHPGMLTVFVPGFLGDDRIRERNGILLRDPRVSLGLWLPDGSELSLAVLAFAPPNRLDAGHAGGGTLERARPTTQTWWTVLVAACGPSLIAAASGQPQRDLYGDAEQIAAWHTSVGRPAPSPKAQSEAFRAAARWLRGLRLGDKTRGWRFAVVEQAINLRLVTLDDVREIFPARVPPEGR